VENNDFSHIKGNDHSTVDGEKRESVGGDCSQNIGGTFHQKSAGGTLSEAGTEVHHKAGAKVVLDAGAELTISAGGSLLKLDPSGVTLSGPGIKINSGGAPGSGSGASAQMPEPPLILGGSQSPEPASIEFQGSATRKNGAAEVISASALPTLGAAAARAAKSGQTFVSGCEFDNSGRCVLHEHG